MSDTITKWHEMEEERKLAENAEQYAKEINETQSTMYIFALDFLDGKVYRYDISKLCNDKNWSSPGYWAVKSEECEAFLVGLEQDFALLENPVRKKDLMPLSDKIKRRKFISVGHFFHDFI